jgi:hypothetical protein
MSTPTPTTPTNPDKKGDPDERLIITIRRLGAPIFFGGGLFDFIEGRMGMRREVSANWRAGQIKKTGTVGRGCQTAVN